MPEARADLSNLHEDLAACALSAIPVDPDDGTTFIKAEGETRIWGPPQVVAAAVASATYTVMGIRLDEAFAAGRAAVQAEFRAQVEGLDLAPEDAVALFGRKTDG